MKRYFRHIKGTPGTKDYPCLALGVETENGTVPEGSDNGDIIIEWVDLGGRPSVRLNLYWDGWYDFFHWMQPVHIIMQEIHGKTATIETFKAMLVRAGFEDRTRKSAPCPPRLTAFTDDLTQNQLYALLAYVVEHGNSYAVIKRWRRNNGLPVDRED